MLNNDLYTVDSITKEEGSSTAVIRLNVLHPIFAGHFPGEPVLPGACMLQMIKEMMEMATGHSIQLQKANHIKFIALIDPTKNDLLQINLAHIISEEGLVVTATLLREDTVCLKFNGVFKIL
ncbi:MAG: 3-hydroxyacyl-ACP dehydratase [Sediminibacterium sp.]